LKPPEQVPYIPVWPIGKADFTLKIQKVAMQRSLVRRICTVGWGLGFGLALVPAACQNEAGPAPVVPAPVPADPPGESRLHRLTRSQIHSSLVDLFGDSIVLPQKLEPDTAIEGLIAIGASRTSISPRGVEQAEQAAYDVAAQVMEPGPRRDALVPCSPAGPVDPVCAAAALEPLGLRVWRRPLTVDEREHLLKLAGQAATTLGDFYDGLEFPIAALLQSPSFLFRTELGEPDPDAPDRLRYTDYEMASRLSFFLWNTTPDDDLLAAAARGELTRVDGLRAQAERLVASPRARAAVRAFFSDLYELHRLDDLVKDPTLFTHMSSEVGPAAREETLRGIEHLVFAEQGDYRDLLTTRRTFLNRKLASIYNVSAPAREGFGAIEWPADSARRGLLGQLSVLALHSHPVASSATKRGKFVRKVLLCAQILPPPVDVNTALPEPSGETRTLRERVAEHLTNPACAGCHRYMDPIGLGLENFDALGRYRTTDNGEPIDPSGELDGTDFADAVALGQVVRDHPDFTPCLVKNLYRYATGHLEGAGERAMLAGLAESFAAHEHRLLPLLIDVVLSDGFRYAVPAPPQDESGEGAGS
jgi:hypothetical protein